MFSTCRHPCRRGAVVELIADDEDDDLTSDERRTLREALSGVLEVG